ncbi:hypothetical protein CERSUDRAFT_83459 [Gelatoporia subvermispora B]|uniref:BZIP domain-containing protein n=1 Tax=Ceriporiopsis subvermispora (strain B) TaxID=914234 RepID=M2QZQ3_CERS8|nr:hypothetical protein CERSUDRAFT_83459 [Gelatoporia subvermispora B]
MQPPPPHLGPPMPYQYAPTDYTPGGMPPPHPQGPPPPHPGPMPEQQPQSQQAGGGRTLSQSKRAEQNRKAQRAFRERRDQHVKALESRSQLLDAALASADEANRRWEECRALVDQLRIENTQLRATIAALQAGQPANPPNSIPLLNGAPQPPANNASQEGENRSNGAETTTEGGEKRD